MKSLDWGQELCLIQLGAPLEGTAKHQADAGDGRRCVRICAPRRPGGN